jgi:hypothetical protein
MYPNEDQHIAATWDELDWCRACHCRVDACQCVEVCIYCTQHPQSEQDAPYCSPLCAVDAEMEERRR